MEEKTKIAICRDECNCDIVVGPFPGDATRKDFKAQYPEYTFIEWENENALQEKVEEEHEAREYDDHYDPNDYAGMIRDYEAGGIYR